MESSSSKPLQIFKFHLSLTLIDHFRSFQQQNHNFLPKYTETINVLIEDLKLRNNDLTNLELFFKKEGTEIDLEMLIISVHFYFGSIANLESFLKIMNNNTTFPLLTKSDVNKTNILNPHTLKAYVDKINMNSNVVCRELQNIQKDYLEEYSICLVKKDEDSEFLPDCLSKSEVYLDLDLFILSIKARGKIDPYMVSYICSRLNNKHSLKLHTILFAMFKNPDYKSIYTEIYGDVAVASCLQQKRFSFSKEKFLKYRSILVNEVPKNKNLDYLINLTSEIESDLCSSLTDMNEKNLHYLEKLLIGMLGSPEEPIRDSAIHYLNVLYDGVDWQLRGAFKPKIKRVGDPFTIDYLIESDPEDNNSICLMLNAPAFGENSNEHVVTWHKPKLYEYNNKNSKEKNNDNYVVISIDFGKFQKCGFYDWKLVKIQKNGKIKGLYKVYNLDELHSTQSFSNLIFENKTYKCKPIHGRFIVHPDCTRKLQIHEVFPDLQTNPNEKVESMIKRGNFLKVRDNMKNYQENGINCIYLMGALERDNGLEVNPITNQKFFSRPEASPLAVTCRKTPCSMLGGTDGLESLMNEAQKRGIKVITDGLTKVSSSRPDKKYKKTLLYTLDEEGKSIVCFGTDGRSIHYEDTALLNYRKLKVWNLIIDEIIEFSGKYRLDGIHLENGQAWPQFLSLDCKEMYRKDPDQTSAYTEKEIFNGEVVLQDENCGYWASRSKQDYANPFLVKICKTLWSRFPNFLIVAEAWGGVGFENREFNIVRSGPIPRMYNLPIALSTLFGKKLMRDGRIVECEKTNVNVFRTWYEHIKKFMSNGSILIQSTTSHIWPYPVLLYKRATWPIIDLFFFLPDIPMTFIGENEGESYKKQTTNIFMKISYRKVEEKNHEINKKMVPKKKNSLKGQKSDQKKKKSNDDDDSEEEEEELRDAFSDSALGYNLNKMRMSVSSKQIQMNPLYLQMSSPIQYQIQEKQHKNFKKTKSDRKIEYEKLVDFMNEDQNQIKAKLERKQSGICIYRVASGVSISDLGIEQMKNAEAFLQSETNDLGFDPKSIGSHYQSRRMIRHMRPVLQEGNFTSIIAEGDEGWHTHVLAFARHKDNQIAIFATNFNDYVVNVYLNLKNLKFIFGDYEETNIVVKMEDWLSNDPEKCEYFTVSELIEDRHFACLNNYSSLLWGVTIYSDPDNTIKNLAFEKSIKRLKYKMNFNKTIYYNEISSLILKAIKSTNKISDFLNYFGYINDKILIRYQIDFCKLMGLLRFLTEDTVTSCKLFAFIKIIEELKVNDPSLPSKLPFINTLCDSKKNHELGPIAFVSSELGKWTSTSGQGVMVNELSESLVRLGEEVCVISPYYDRNRKGQTNYINSEGEEFKYTFNFDVKIGKETFPIGVHEGHVNNVQIFFLHNPSLFPSSNVEGDAIYTLKQIVLLAKASLEVLCQKKIVPSIIISNDWFTGLIPAYAKKKAFGDIFDKTKFFHLIHNLSLMYDGRIYLGASEDSLQYIHELPEEWLIDPSWSEKFLNPSRCALMTCDQWGTVSNAYKEEIIQFSPLSSLLKKFKKPFGFPNGIPKDIRLSKIIELCNNDHFEAKRIIQKKYFKFNGLDNNVCLMSFIGRITEQKGVHLILQSLDQLLAKYSGKIQFLLGGQANLRENYGAYCAELMWKLRNKYPHNFWAAPNEYFDDVTLISVGSDFGLMPSLFEPGGIVQHEFFVGSTPVVAFKTGGLKDTILDFEAKTRKGNGVTFLDHKVTDFIQAIDKAIEIYKNPQLYNIIRKNAFESTMDSADVGRAWDKEFHRLFHKIYVDNEVLLDQYKSLNKEFNLSEYQISSPIKYKQGRISGEKDSQIRNFERAMAAHAKSNLKKYIFKYSTSVLPRPKNVSLVGTFDDWNTKYPLFYDYFTHIWTITLYLKPGEYYYKFIVDGKWVCSEDEPKNNDTFGNINNYLII